MHWLYFGIIGYMVALTIAAASAMLQIGAAEATHKLAPGTTQACLPRLAALDLLVLTPGLGAFAALCSDFSAAWQYGLVLLFIHLFCVGLTGLTILRGLRRHGAWPLGKTTAVAGLGLELAGLALSQSALPALFAYPFFVLGGVLLLFSLNRLHGLVYQAQDTSDRTLKPVVYLRSFHDEHTSFADVAGQLYTFEEFVGEAIRDTLGPVVALGNPQEAVAGGIAARTYLPDDGWQEYVSELLAEARAILLLAGSSQSLGWELGRIRTMGLHTKLFVVTAYDVPERSIAQPWHAKLAACLAVKLAACLAKRAGIPEPVPRARQAATSHIVQLLTSHGFHGLPSELPAGALVAFSQDGAARVVQHETDPARWVETMNQWLGTDLSLVTGQVERTARRSVWYWVLRYVQSHRYSVVWLLAMAFFVIQLLMNDTPTPAHAGKCTAHGGPKIMRVYCAIFGH